MQQATIADLFILSIDAENEARDFYQFLSKAFTDNDFARDLFTEMTNDEITHIENIQRMRDEISPEKLRKTAPENASNLIRSFLNFSASEGIKRVNDLEDAYRISVNLEFSEINKLHELLVGIFAPSEAIRKLNFDLVKAHMGKLEIFKEETGDTEARRNIKSF